LAHEIFDDLRQYYIEACKKVSEWREIGVSNFSKVSRARRELHEELMKKFKNILPFPRL
jgi:hypothetical protein